MAAVRERRAFIRALAAKREGRRGAERGSRSSRGPVASDCCSTPRCWRPDSRLGPNPLPTAHTLMSSASTGRTTCHGDAPRRTPPRSDQPKFIAGWATRRPLRRSRGLAAVAWKVVADMNAAHKRLTNDPNDDYLAPPRCRLMPTWSRATTRPASSMSMAREWADPGRAALVGRSRRGAG